MKDEYSLDSKKRLRRFNKTKSQIDAIASKKGYGWKNGVMVKY